MKSKKKAMFVIVILGIITFTGGPWFLFEESKKYRNNRDEGGWFMVYLYNWLHQNNTFILETEGISLDSVDIYLDSPEKIQLFSKGKQLKKIKSMYGGHQFRVQIDGNDCFKFYFLNSNGWQSHNFKLYLEKKGQQINAHFVIDGPEYEELRDSLIIPVSDGIINTKGAKK